MKSNLTAWLRVVAAFVGVTAITYSLHFARGGASPAPDYECRNTGTQINIEIPIGASGSQVGEILYKNGVVKSSASYFRAAVANPKSTLVAPGGHLLTGANCAKSALLELLDTKRLTGLVSITEGAWNSEIIDSMAKVGFSKVEVAAAIKSAPLPSGYTSAEGLLFPAQYSFTKNSTASSAIAAMINRGKNEIEKNGLLAGGGKYSPAQLLIIASIIQAEGDAKDFSKISQVIRNRLEKGIPLQMDSTVHYVKKSRGKVFLSTSSTLLKSPFNTYRNYGLPPSPIGNPGADAMKAAVNPLLGDWTFFITIAPGDTRFTSSIDEFNKWKVLYKKNLRAGLFRSNE